MREYDASDLKSIRKAQREAKAEEAERKGVVLNLMSSHAGRAYIYDRLLRCHIFSSSFSESSVAMAFAEGERNIGLQDLTEVMRFAPDQYVQMMREANDKEITNGGRNSSGRSRGDADAGGDDYGPNPADAGGEADLFDPREPVE